MKELEKKHLVSWEKICRPKSDGGLGIRSAKEMNMALLGKLGWRLMNTQYALWVRILRKKFRVGELSDPSWMIVKGGWSPTWRSLVLGIREAVVLGTVWILGDGRRVRFWKDNWLLNEPLYESSMVHIPVEILEVKARDLWQNGVGWMM